MKRVISYLFVVALVLSVFACGGAKENKEAETTTPETKTEIVEEGIVNNDEINEESQPEVEVTIIEDEVVE